MKLFAALTAFALLTTPAARATEISVSFSDKFQERLEDDYGLREAERLAENVSDDILRAFEKKGVSAAKVDILIDDARPNRPTFKQIGDRPGLDGFRSISIGGAKLTGTVRDASGEAIATLDYRWYENDIRQARFGGTWSDANVAFRRFAGKLARNVASEG